jgi:hypothetical protein
MLTGHTYRTIRKYKTGDPDILCRNLSTAKRRDSKLDVYRNLIIRKLSEGVILKDILYIITKQGSDVARHRDVIVGIDFIKVFASRKKMKNGGKIIYSSLLRLVQVCYVIHYITSKILSMIMENTNQNSSIGYLS